MPPTSEQHYQHIGESPGCADHDHDLVHELSRRLDALWRYDQYIANAGGHSNLIEFWQQVKQQEQDNIQRIKELIREEIHRGCF